MAGLQQTSKTDLTARASAQAKALGDVLVVGLIPDSEILRCKGPPVMNEAERFTMVNSVKWVDEVLTGVASVQMACLFGLRLLIGQRCSCCILPKASHVLRDSTRLCRSPCDACMRLSYMQRGTACEYAQCWSSPAPIAARSI